MNRVTFAILMILGVVLVPTPAKAHVLIRDDSKQIGAILHVYPDDDPVAGEYATLLYDIQLPSDMPDNLYAKLQITEPDGSATIRPIKLSNNSGGLNYTFPVQGAYPLKLSIETTDKTYTFNYTQRVTRGAAASALDRPRFAWAEATLVACGTMLLLLLIIGLNRRHEIVEQSKF
jgi:hypothetical protein